MATPVFYGWKIVIVCFLIALFSAQAPDPLPHLAGSHL
jgi:hypothetical protein